MSSSKSHKVIEYVWVAEPDIQSRAAYVKLKRIYKTLDIDYKKCNSEFRRGILNIFIQKHGKLFCEYCGKTDLIFNGKIGNSRTRKTHLATMDHIKPLSKGGNPYDPNNIKICCPNCNTAKGSLCLDEFISKEKLSIHTFGLTSQV